MEELIEIREGRRLNVLVEQPESSECKGTIFLFHGSMASLTQFRHLSNHYKKNFRVVSYDAYGCGNSEKPVDDWFGETKYSVRNLLLDAIEIFLKYATSKNILVGHSFGTTIVARIVHYFQINPSKLTNGAAIVAAILLGTADDMPSRRWSILALPVLVLEWLHPILSAHFADKAFSPSVDPEIKKDAMKLSGTNEMHVVRSFYVNCEWATPEIWQSCFEMLPVLIVQGLDDKITPIEKAQALSQMFPQSQSQLVVIDKVGHQLMQENPTAVIDCINTFIAKIL